MIGITTKCAHPQKIFFQHIWYVTRRYSDGHEESHETPTPPYDCIRAFDAVWGASTNGVRVTWFRWAQRTYYQHGPALEELQEHQA